MKQYLDLCRDVLENGERRNDRTGTGTISIFGRQMKFNLQDGFPLVTTKKMFFKGIIHELLWMISGSQSIKYLKDNGVHIWDPWANEMGTVGPMYGYQWRKWPEYKRLTMSSTVGNTIILSYNQIDQLNKAIHEIKENPTSRRILVSAWNVADIPEMALPPCHVMYQFYVRRDKYLDCHVYQRSADVFLGLPWDIALYATLMHMVAYLTDKKPGILTYSLGDTHIYLNHVEQVKLQLTREPKGLPVLMVNKRNRKIESIDDFTYDDFELIGYNPHPAIKGEISI